LDAWPEVVPPSGIKKAFALLLLAAPAPRVPITRGAEANAIAVIGIARHSETMEELVVYRALYGERCLWVRPSKMFQESVVIDGRRMPRFEFLGPLK
jgi:hypothetical protein